jgi:hypothetical protein
MTTYRCPAGHQNEIEFGEEIKKPCRVCGADVLKFRDQSQNESTDIGNATDPKTPATTGKKGNLSSSARKTWIFVAIGVYLAFVALWLWNRSTLDQKPAAVTGASVLPFADNRKAPSNAALASGNNLKDIAVTDFKAEVTSPDNVKITVVLTNNGGASNDYPTLDVHWKESAAQDTLIPNTAYTHPAGPFSRVEVQTELQKPSDASGVELSVKY